MYKYIYIYLSLCIYGHMYKQFVSNAWCLAGSLPSTTARYGHWTALRSWVRRKIGALGAKASACEASECPAYRQVCACHEIGATSHTRFRGIVILRFNSLHKTDRRRYVVIAVVECYCFLIITIAGSHKSLDPLPPQFFVFQHSMEIYQPFYQAHKRGGCCQIGLFHLICCPLPREFDLCRKTLRCEPLFFEKS